MARTIIVGDIHGCRDELVALLERVGFDSDDRLFTVGDHVVRGPAPRRTLDLLERLGARGVRGNHEDRLLRWRKEHGESAGGAITKATGKMLRKRHFKWMERLPLWIDLPEHDLTIVHAGVVPGLPLSQQAPRVLMYVRCLGAGNEALEGRGRVPWGERYEGPTHLVFGHNALPEPQLHRWATGIDTGAVYGGRLTALVLREGERLPAVADRNDVLVSVPARRAYFPR